MTRRRSIHVDTHDLMANIDIFLTNLRILLSNFIVTDVYALFDIPSEKSALFDIPSEKSAT